MEKTQQKIWRSLVPGKVVTIERECVSFTRKAWYSEARKKYIGTKTTVGRRRNTGTWACTNEYYYTSTVSSIPLCACQVTCIQDKVKRLKEICSGRTDRLSKKG